MGKTSFLEAKTRPDRLAQLRIIEKANPAPDDYHTWIRELADVLTLSEAITLPDWREDIFNPDWTRTDAITAIRADRLTIYSSKPITAGVFVSPSRLEALSYAPDGRIYTMTVSPFDVAWIDPTQGQYAPINANNRIKEK